MPVQALCCDEHVSTSESAFSDRSVPAGSGLAGSRGLRRRKSEFIGAASYHRTNDPENLIGCRVVLRDLENSPELNGKAGVVESWKESTGRYSITLDDRGDASFHVKPEKIISTGATAAPTAEFADAYVIDNAAARQNSINMCAALASSLSACAESLLPLQNDHPAANDPNFMRQLTTLLSFLQEHTKQIGGLDVLAEEKAGNLIPVDESHAALNQLNSLQSGLMIALQLNMGMELAAGSALAAVREHKAANPPKLPEIVQEVLRDPSKSYSLEKKIECITACIREGNDAAMETIDEDILVILGNTGAGKSTFVNWLHGCKLQQVKKNKVPGYKGTGKVVVVAPAGTEPSEMMAIGHSKASMTFIPGIQRDSNFVYVDCPGFLDNRGSSVNVADATNIKLTVSRAKTVKVRC